MQKKKVLTFFLLLLVTLSWSQNEKKLYVKGNALFIPLGIINTGVEYQLGSKYTIQGDVLISPWKSFAGKRAQIYMIGFEPRYYFNEAFKHWYVGANISAARYMVQKWNYWSDAPYQFTPDSPVYVTSDLYQDGYSILLGATVGYQFKLSEKLNADVYLGVGTNQGFYKGIHKDLGIRYDETDKWNRSGEFIPYRGGIMISYQLK